jgi:hypothetical protein
MGEVFEHSRAEHAARLVLIAIADNASQLDGVAWPSQEEIARKTLLGERTVRDAIDELVELGELETRLGQSGRIRQNVYRVTVGRYQAADVVYKSIPFSLREPFSRPADSAGRQGEGGERQAGSRRVERLWSRPAKSAARQELSRPAKSAVTTGRIPPRTSKEGTVKEPSAAAARLADSLGDAAAANLEQELRTLRAGSKLRELAFAHPERALAWIQVAKLEADRPAGFVLRGLESGEWPSERGDAFRSAASTRTWIEEVSWRLDPEHAHELLDERCSKVTIDPVELAELHELVDETRAHREQAARETAA